MLNFRIENKGLVSQAFLGLHIFDFAAACTFVARLPYKRNKQKDNITCIFEEHGGTCSTKHAVLRKLALENDIEDIKLILGIFRMDTAYSLFIADTLREYRLAYIPEAHNYLKIGEAYFDFTKPGAAYKDFEKNLLQEQEIAYSQVTAWKTAIHKAFLAKWLSEEQSSYTLEEIWQIREKCIENLQRR